MNLPPMCDHYVEMQLDALRVREAEEQAEKEARKAEIKAYKKERLSRLKRTLPVDLAAFIAGVIICLATLAAIYLRFH